MGNSDLGPTTDKVPWSSPCYLLATVELHDAGVSKKTNNEEAKHCMMRSVQLLQGGPSHKKFQDAPLDATTRKLPHKKLAEEMKASRGTPQEGPLERKSSSTAGDNIVSAITGLGAREGTVSLKDSCVCVSDKDSVVWQLENRVVTAVAALGTDGALVVMGGKHSSRRAVTLRFPNQTDAKGFITAFQAVRKSKMSSSQRQSHRPETEKRALTKEHSPKVDESLPTPLGSIAGDTATTKRTRSLNFQFPEQKTSLNLEPLSQDLPSSPSDFPSGSPPPFPGELQTPTSPLPCAPPTSPEDLEEPLVSITEVSMNMESSHAPLDPLTPTSPPPLPPVKLSASLSKLSVGDTSRGKEEDPGQNPAEISVDSPGQKSMLPSSGVLIASLSVGEKIQEGDEAQNSILTGSKSLLPSLVSPIRQKIIKKKSKNVGTQEGTNENKVQSLGKQLQAEPKGVISEKFRAHSNQFVKDEHAYCDNLRQLIVLMDKVEDDCVSMSLSLLTEIVKTHEKIVNILVNSEQMPSDFANVFIDHREELFCYVDLIRTSAVLDDQNFEDPEGHIRTIVGKMQIIRLKPHHYTLTLESWMEHVGQEDKQMLETAVCSLKQISKRADDLLLIDAVRMCPYNLSFHCPLQRYGEYHVTGKGFQSKQKYTVLLMTDLIVFTTSSGTNSFDCVDALRLEHILIQDSTEPDIVILDINYGERRGRESIHFKCSTEGEARNWKRDIINKRLEYAKKIMFTHEHDNVVQTKMKALARWVTPTRDVSNYAFRENLGHDNMKKVELARKSSMFYVDGDS